MYIWRIKGSVSPRSGRYAGTPAAGWARSAETDAEPGGNNGGTRATGAAAGALAPLGGGANVAVSATEGADAAGADDGAEVSVGNSGAVPGAAAVALPVADAVGSAADGGGSAVTNGL